MNVIIYIFIYLETQKKQTKQNKNSEVTVTKHMRQHTVLNFRTQTCTIMLAKQRTHVDVYIQNKIQSRRHHTLQNYELTWTIQQEQTSQ